VCFVVTLTGLVFLPGQALSETSTTDAPGRSVWVAAVVVALGCAAEGIRLVERRLRG
jgi:hypothetical protein